MPALDFDKLCHTIDRQMKLIGATMEDYDELGRSIGDPASQPCVSNSTTYPSLISSCPFLLHLLSEIKPVPLDDFVESKAMPRHNDVSSRFCFGVKAPVFGGIAICYPYVSSG